MPAEPQSLKEVFLAALAVAPEKRVAWLEQACDDADLRRHVELMLAAHDTPQSLLDRLAPDAVRPAPLQARPAATIDEPVPECPGTVIGPYKLLEQIGEGGFGVVFLAEQTEPVRRKVALKVLKPGMDTRQVVARFEAERQALAIMDHPNIAKVFDGGATASGRPYFVMEFVKGVPITEFCDRNHLTPRQRLELFVPVCQAVQHAHQKGIIHRDLKPSNVLVSRHDTTPVVKVIDFGVAKALGQELTDKTLFTGVAQMIGTPLYMSPEQAGMSDLDIDTRSDIYSLGVLLYELLTGTTPFTKERFKKAAYDEIRRIIREEEPPKPSTRLSESKDSLPSVSAQRHTEPAKLTKLVRGELDWIVMKALEKDRNRRYETANGFAMDVQRYLADEPVQACPPSMGYRLRKFVRRNQGPVLAAALIFLALAAGVVGTTVGLIRAELARQAEQKQRELADERKKEAVANEQHALEEKRIAQAVRDFLQKKLLSQADSFQQADALVAGGGLARDVEPDPRISVLLARAAAELAPDKIEVNFSEQPLVQAELLRTIGQTYRGIGDIPSAVRHFERARDLFRSQLGEQHRDTMQTLYHLALAYLSLGRVSEAVPMMEFVYKVNEARQGAEHEDTLAALHGLALMQQAAGNLAEAIRLFEKVRRACVATLGMEDPRTLKTMSNLAMAYKESGLFSEAFSLLAQVRDVQVANLGAEHPDTTNTVNHLATVYQQAGNLPEAIRLLEWVRDVRVAKLGPEHPSTLAGLSNLANTYRMAGRSPEAIPIYERVRDVRMAKLGPDQLPTLLALNGLAVCYQAVGRLPEATQLFELVRSVHLAKQGVDHPLTLTAHGNLARAYEAAGRHPEALSLYEEAMRGIEKRKFRHEGAGPILANYLGALEAAKQFDQAEIWHRKWLSAVKEHNGADSRYYAIELAALGSRLLSREKWPDAEVVLRECLTIRQGKEPDAWTTFNTRSMLGEALLGQKKYAEAEPLLLSGYEGMKAHEAQIRQPVRKTRLTEALKRLVALYEATAKNDMAEKWRKELEAAKAEKDETSK